MLLPGDLVVWDKELSKDDRKDVGEELANLGELAQNKIETLPHIVVTKDAFDYFLESNDLQVKIKHLLGTLNHERHESIAQISLHIRNLIEGAKIPDRIHKPLYKMLEATSCRRFSLRSFYFDKDKLLITKETSSLEGDAVVMEKLRESWAQLFSTENIGSYLVHTDNHLNLKVVVAVIPMFEFSLTGYAKHAEQNEYVIEAHEMSRFSFSKTSKKIEEAIVLPGGKKDALSAGEIKELLDIAHITEKLFYIPHTVYWGRHNGEILATRVVQSTSSHKDPFNTLIDAVTVHPGITVGRLRVVNEKTHEGLTFENEIIVLNRLDKKMTQALRKVKGIILKEDPHPDVKQLLREYGIPTVVKNGSMMLYSTGDIISLNAATGEIKRGNMLVS